jgi:prepilin-type N-terminal cleavage/methylation domain-containing protein
MKRRKQTAFTLIELLVVMAIIGIMMALLMPVFAKARLEARKKKAKSEVKQLEIAFNSYLNDYRTWGSLSVADGSPHDVDPTVVSILGGQTSTANPRRVQYMEFNSKSISDGSQAGVAAGCFVDPWGSPYRFVLDRTYKNSVNTGRGAAGGDVVSRNVAVWSKGENNGLAGSGTTSDPADDVTSWE